MSRSFSIATVLLLPFGDSNMFHSGAMIFPSVRNLIYTIGQECIGETQTIEFAPVWLNSEYSYKTLMIPQTPGFGFSSKSDPPRKSSELGLASRTARLEDQPSEIEQRCVRETSGRTFSGGSPRKLTEIAVDSLLT